jgi:hypothetical protein
MSNLVTVKFITNYQTTRHLIHTSIFTDSQTKEPYKFATVHGRTWQINFFSEMPVSEAFTPCPEYCNHRGIYKWCSVEKAYIR